MSGNRWVSSILCPFCRGRTKLSRLTRGSRKCYSCGKIVVSSKCIFVDRVRGVFREDK